MRKLKPSKTIARSNTVQFVQYPTRMLRSERFGDLSPIAHKVLNYLAGQYDGSNNGDLQCTPKLARIWGIASNDSITSSLIELERCGFIIRTRQGGKNHCSLFALAWFKIDPCKGKTHVAATNVAPNTWLWNEKNCIPLAGQVIPQTVQRARMERDKK